MNALITNIINNVFHAIWFCSIVAEPKHSRKKTMLIVIATTAIYQAVGMIGMYLRATGILPYETVSITTSYFIVFLVGMFLYAIMFVFFVSASHPAKSLFLFNAYMSVWAVIYGLTSIITNTYAGAGNAIIWGLRIGLNLAVLIPYLLFFRERLFSMFKEIQSGYGMIFALSIFCFLMQCLFLFYNDRMRNHEAFFMVIMLSSFVFIVAVYAMIFQFMAQSDHTHRMRQLESNEKFLMSQIAAYEKMAENARRTRHDFRHHNMVVMEYARNKDYEGILSYLQEYEEKETEKYVNTFCQNHAVDNVLSAYVNKCEQNDIEVNTDIWLADTGEISDYDMVTILANILENAVNGCIMTDGRRRIDISIGQKSGKVVLVCKNTCVPDILFEDGLPRNKERKGVGVDSIIHSADKYGGDVDFSAMEGIFICRVMLNA